jgi:general secretion pathway protein D
MSNESKNQLIVYAHEDRVREIENYVAVLDTKATRVESNYHVYKLINTLAKEMSDTLKQFIDQAQVAETQAQTGGAAGATPPRREQKPVIREDEKSNSLLISANRTQYEKIIELIHRLDQRQQQVLIETALIELGTQDISKLGVELGLLDLGSGKRPFGLTSFGISTLEDTDGNGLPDTRLPDLQNPLRGLTGGIISSSDFAIPLVLNALKSDSESNVLSIPSVLVNNNENAIVTSKDAFPTTRATTGNVTTDTTFSGFQDAGIELRISPSISEGNYVKLNIHLEVSKFTGSFDSTSAVPPPKTTRTIETVVTMPSGNTMVFGGVIEDQSSETSDGIPFLKDIPLLGILFRSQEKTNRKTNLYFFLTPHILSDKDFADLEAMTFRKKLEAADYIGNRRLKIVDRDWRGGELPRLDDPKATLEDIDRLGGFSIPTYERPPAGSETKPTGTESPPRGEPKDKQPAGAPVTPTDKR